jgi:hypothetical protein
MAKNRFDDMFAEADEAFDCKYQNELDELTSLLKEELSLLTPNSTNEGVYSALIVLVSQASKENLAQAQLIDRIKEMGETAIELAKKVPSFAKLN